MFPIYNPSDLRKIAKRKRDEEDRKKEWSAPTIKKLLKVLPAGNDDRPIYCGRVGKIYPEFTIRMKNDKPNWKKIEEYMLVFIKDSYDPDKIIYMGGTYPVDIIIQKKGRSQTLEIKSKRADAHAFKVFNPPLGQELCFFASNSQIQKLEPDTKKNRVEGYVLYVLYTKYREQYKIKIFAIGHKSIKLKS